MSDQIIEAIQQENAETENQLIWLNNKLALLNEILAKQKESNRNYCGPTPTISPDQFTDKCTSQCMREFLRSIWPRGATDKELVRALEAGGWPRKKYSLRQVSLARANSS